MGQKDIIKVNPNSGEHSAHTGKEEDHGALGNDRAPTPPKLRERVAKEEELPPEMTVKTKEPSTEGE